MSDVSTRPAAAARPASGGGPVPFTPGVLARAGTRRRTTGRDGPPKALLATVGLLAALGASSCCVPPFALFLVGIGGAWIGNLTALAPYQPIFVAVAPACLVGGFAALYRRPKATACAQDSHCARPTSDRIARAALWGTAVLVAAALAFPYAASVLL